MMSNADPEASGKSCQASNSWILPALAPPEVVLSNLDYGSDFLQHSTDDVGAGSTAQPVSESSSQEN